MSCYASGKHAFGFCDRTGFRYKLRDLVPQIEAGRPNGMLVGKDVVDVDNPQWKLGLINMSDPQALSTGLTSDKSFIIHYRIKDGSDFQIGTLSGVSNSCLVVVIKLAKFSAIITSLSNRFNPASKYVS